MKINNFVSKITIYQIFLYSIFFISLLPILNIFPWFFPLDWGKTMIFKGLVTFDILLFVILIFKKEINLTVLLGQKKLKIGIFVLLSLLVSALISTIFSFEPVFSLWGDPSRGGGFINFCFFIIFTLLSVFLIKNDDWKKIWNFSILLGSLVAIIGIFQQFGIFSTIFDYSPSQITSTIGTPFGLGIYLLLLFFISLSFGIKEKNVLRKILYFFSLLLLGFTIFLTISQASYLGLGTGLLFFFFFYPKKLKILKISALILMVLIISGIFFIKKHPQDFIKNNVIFSAVTSWSIDKSRVSAWKVSLNALKNRPIFGYGPEEFSIGFDKYYDFSLPGIQKDPNQHNSWWDRAHNFIFDISVTLGLLGLFSYLFLFGFLFFVLQKLKNIPEKKNENLIILAVQSTFIAYFTANFFSFDSFSSYLISFLIIGYSLSLLKNIDFFTNSKQKLSGSKTIVLVIILIFFILFIYNFSIKTIQINSEINIAKKIAENGYYEQALIILEKQLKNHSILDHYLRLEYGEVIGNYILENPDLTKALAEKARNRLLENVKIRPYYTRNWLLLLTYTNMLREKEENIDIANMLKKQANEFLEKAKQLSPKRQEVLVEIINTYIIDKEYQKAEKEAQFCININKSLGDCWWYLGLVDIYLNKPKDAKDNIETARENGYNTESMNSFFQLVRVYQLNNDYKNLITTFKNIIEKKPDNAQYRATFAYIYKLVGDFENAKKEALEVLRISPKNKNEVEYFLNHLYD